MKHFTLLSRLYGRASFQIALLLLVSGILADSQVTYSQKQLVNEYYGMNCESGNSIVDAFLVELNKDAGGLIIIQPERGDIFGAYKQRSVISNHLLFRRFDGKRIKFGLGESGVRLKTELWAVPTGEIRNDLWDFSVPEKIKPVLFHSEDQGDGIGCSYVFSLKFYSDFLNANSNLIGRIVIHDRSVQNFERKRARLQNELLNEMKVSKAKVEFAYIQSEVINIEYWYLPAPTIQIKQVHSRSQW